MSKLPPNAGLLPWKKAPPQAPDEAATAELLKQVGGPATLSPDAFSRIGRRLREPRRRLQLFPEIRLALLAGGTASVAIVLTLSFLMFGRHGAQLAAPVAPSNADQLAFADRPAAAVGAGELDEETVRREAPAKKRVFAVPPSDKPVLPTFGTRSGAGGSLQSLGHSRAGAKADALAAADQPIDGSEGKSLRKSKKAVSGGPRDGVGLADSDSAGLRGMEVADEQASPTVGLDARGLEMEKGSNAAGAPAGAVASRSRFASPPPSAPAAASASAPAAARAPVAAASAEPDATDAEEDRCLQDFPQARTEGQGAAAERALFDRAQCRLKAGLREQGRGDLRRYLARFPNGQFAQQARALLQ